MIVQTGRRSEEPSWPRYDQTHLCCSAEPAAKLFRALSPMACKSNSHTTSVHCLLPHFKTVMEKSLPGCTSAASWFSGSPGLGSKKRYLATACNGNIWLSSGAVFVGVTLDLYEFVMSAMESACRLRVSNSLAWIEAPSLSRMERFESKLWVTAARRPPRRWTAP